MYNSDWFLFTWFFTHFFSFVTHYFLHHFFSWFINFSCLFPWFIHIFYFPRVILFKHVHFTHIDFHMNNSFSNDHVVQMSNVYPSSDVRFQGVYLNALSYVTLSHLRDLFIFMLILHIFIHILFYINNFLPIW